MLNIVHFYWECSRGIVLELSPWLMVLVVLIVTLLLVYRRIAGRRLLDSFEPVEAEIELGGLGKVTLRPNLQDIEIAHKVWTQLVTRKAAIPVDEENDVIVEIYDSWHSMFSEVRRLISDIPASRLRSSKSTQEIVRIATTTLNEGVRPHLTRWHARFRNWYEANSHQLKDKTPQELHREYPEYENLMADMRKTNEELIGYARALGKIAHGK